ncbi:MAG: hypothetical protein JWR88_1044 [Pseudonocardia sp.]|nr:hypothetical protein [Pseudonocardia sp.]
MTKPLTVEKLAEALRSEEIADGEERLRSWGDLAEAVWPLVQEALAAERRRTSQDIVEDIIAAYEPGTHERDPLAPALDLVNQAYHNGLNTAARIAEKHAEEPTDG